VTINALYDAVRHEEQETERFLHLTANEALMSRTARAFLASEVADHYFMGAGDQDGIIDFGPFTFRGLPAIGALVSEAEAAARDMLGAAEVNLKCLSGVHAMMCAILSTTEPGDTVMTVDLAHGGHFATKLIVERTGRRHVPTSYDFSSLTFDTEALAADFRRAGASALYLDVSYYLNPHNLVDLRRALGLDALIIYDASHTLGLIMGGIFQNPFAEGADVICGNTHKTLPGPQKGLIAFRDPGRAATAGAIINSGLFSSSHTASMVALATTILEMRDYGHDYARQIVANSNALGAALDAAGHRLRRANSGRFSENHQVHVLTEHLGDYRELYVRLRDNLISINFDNALGAGTYIRIGTQQVTRRGMFEADMSDIATLIDAALNGAPVRHDVASLVGKFPQVHYSYDVSGG
jgi:glycine/serine hydroxymethyltransferase